MGLDATIWRVEAAGRGPVMLERAAGAGFRASGVGGMGCAILSVRVDRCVEGKRLNMGGEP